jgi:multimeric flavodoxin WrbA
MIIILYDVGCNLTHAIALKIKTGIEREIVPCYLMTIDDIDIARLTLARCIIFGCPSRFSGGVSHKMSKFMDKTRNEFENQVWKNKFAAGFTVETEISSNNVIEEICNFSAKHSMIWISQGHLEENEAHGTYRRVNSNKSYLGCVASVDQIDTTAEWFGIRVGRQVRVLLNMRGS